eukprot:7424644-Lingulodinium_polyedra.AAC.1
MAMPRSSPGAAPSLRRTGFASPTTLSLLPNTTVLLQERYHVLNGAERSGAQRSGADWARLGVT